MCGIIGIVSQKPVADKILAALDKLSYRGYDSAGIAVVNGNNIYRLRAPGNLSNLVSVYEQQPIDGNVGIGHTRWATHGEATEGNAHPHSNNLVAVIHNGIIDNFYQYKVELQAIGVKFESETDTEVLVHMLSTAITETADIRAAATKVLKKLTGAFAIAVAFRDFPHQMLVARRGMSPLVVGYGTEQMFVASDALALAGLAEKLVYLEDQECAILSHDQAVFFDFNGRDLRKSPLANEQEHVVISKAGYEHFMLKEIYEQPQSVHNSINKYLHGDVIDFPGIDLTLSTASIPTALSSSNIPLVSSSSSIPTASSSSNIPLASSFNRLSIVACGTAYYASFIAKCLLEELARIPVVIETSSEFKYRRPPLTAGDWTMAISQSGESVDTLAALLYAKECQQHVLSLVNVRNSSIDRYADYRMYTAAGPEVSVASTKAFTAQVAVLALFALKIAHERGCLEHATYNNYLDSLRLIASQINDVLQLADTMRQIANEIDDAQYLIYLGRKSAYPVALEGALKMTELTYRNVMSLPAGELKHGPISVVDSNVVTIFIAPSYDVDFKKNLSSMQEIKARGGRLVILTDAMGREKVAANTQTQDKTSATRDKIVVLPPSNSVTFPILYVIPLQLLAYYAAVRRGHNVDQPRNLAKSVTVE